MTSGTNKPPPVDITMLPTYVAKMVSTLRHFPRRLFFDLFLHSLIASFLAFSLSSFVVGTVGILAFYVGVELYVGFLAISYT